MIREKSGSNLRQIKVSVAGSFETDTGQKTSTLLEQLERMSRVDLFSFLSSSTDEARIVLEKANLIKDFKHINKTKTQGIQQTGKFYTDDSDLFLDNSPVDVIIISEINTGLAVRVIYECIHRKKNVINLNAVSEVTLGVLFKWLAGDSGVIYTVGAGDEPAATLELIKYCDKLGLEIIAAGKGKNNPLDINCSPDDFSDIEKQIEVSAQSIASFVDGTKTMLEMAILSNSTGFKIDKTGMHGPQANVADLSVYFCPIGDGGILNNIPAVDYAVGDIAPGVFVVFTSGQESILDELNYLKMGSGPYYVLYKPYHLGNIEAPLSVFDVVVEKKPTLNVKESFVTSVAGRAKRTLKMGEILDGAGGYTYSGLAVDFNLLINNNYVPIGLLENSEIISETGRDEIISFSDIKCNKNSLIYQLWDRQIKLV